MQTKFVTLNGEKTEVPSNQLRKSGRVRASDKRVSVQWRREHNTVCK